MTMAYMYVVVIALLSLPIVCVDTQTYRDADKLYTDVLSGYNKYVRPVLNQVDKVQVNVSYDIGVIQEINEVEGTMTVYFQFQYSWIDEKLSWNPYFYNNTYILALPADAIWKPELVLAASAGPVVSLDSSMTIVKYYPNGKALWFPSGVISVSCGINIKYYPFDTQTCPITFMVSNYFSTEMVLNSMNKEAPLSFYMANGMWDLAKTEAKVIDTGIQMFEVNLSLVRRPAFVVIIVIAPIMLLSVLNILVFLLPADSGERMSFTITLLLAQTVFMTIISDNIPHTSSPLSILCYFLGMQVLLSTIICVATILNLRLYHKDENEPIPFWISRLFKGDQMVHVSPEGKSDDRNGWTNELDLKPNAVSNDGIASNAKPDIDTTDTWTFFKKPRTDNKCTKVKAKITWKAISKSVDMVLFIASILYFVIVFVVFAFVTGFHKEA